MGLEPDGWTSRAYEEGRILDMTKKRANDVFPGLSITALEQWPNPPEPVGPITSSKSPLLKVDASLPLACCNASSREAIKVGPGGASIVRIVYYYTRTGIPHSHHELLSVFA